MANSGVNGIVRPVTKTYVGVGNIARTVQNTYVGVNNAVRTANKTYAGVEAPFTEVLVVLDGVMPGKVEEDGNGNASLTFIEPYTLENGRNYATILIDETNRSLEIRGIKTGYYGVEIQSTTYVLSNGIRKRILDAIGNTNTFSMTVICSCGYGGGSASGRGLAKIHDYEFHPNGWSGSFYESKTFSKEDIASSFGYFSQYLNTGGYTYQRLTFPAAAQVNGLDIPVTLINELK